MKIEVNNKDLYEAVLVVSRAVSAKSAIPVLEGILIKTGDNKISLIGYDLDVGITTDIGAKIISAGEIVINAKLLADIVKNMPNEFATITVNSNKMIKFECGNSEFSIIGYDAAEYPEMPTIVEQDKLMLSEALLKKMVRQTSFAVSQIDIKPILKGVLFELAENSLKMVAVDGYRLALRKETVKNNRNFNFVIAGKTLLEISKVLDDNGEREVEIIIAKRHISFKIGNYSFISRLLDGEFLNYEMAIPKTTTTTVITATSELLSMIERVSLLINDRIASPVGCIFEEDCVKAFCSTAMGKGNDEIKSKNEGERVEISFNNRFLIDALRACDDADIKLEMTSSRSPIVIKPLDGDYFTYLILPIMVRNDE